MSKDLEGRIDAVEECYEFMLAYAAQGLGGDEGSATGGQLRHQLTTTVGALTGLADVVRQQGLRESFVNVLERDAVDSLATIEMVLAQPHISSQLIDNLNASIHLRALLTDLFLVDEIVKIQSKARSQVALGVDSPDSLLESVTSNDN